MSRICILAVVLSAVSVDRALADWPTDAAVNVAVSREGSGEGSPLIATDGAGGAVLAWSAVKASDGNVLGARILATGLLSWSPTPLGVAVGGTDDRSPSITDDGAGGTIICWRRGTSLFAQRVSGEGARMWGFSGIQVASDVNDRPLAIVHDGAQGAFVAWSGGNGVDLYVHRIDAAGNPVWPAGGVGAAIVTGLQHDPSLAADGCGGVVVAWTDARSMLSVYAQRLDADGTPLWAPNGVAVDAQAASVQTEDPIVVADGCNGAFVSYEEIVSVPRTQVQRLGADGQRVGDRVTISARRSGWHRMVADGAGGVILVADGSGEDYASSDSDVWAQRIDATGTPLWGAGGRILCNDPATQRRSQVISDHQGGAYFVWQDVRAGTNGWDLYAQRLDASGVTQWHARGVRVSSAASSQINPQLVLSATGGIVVVWEDHRNNPGGDIYAQHVDTDGSIGSKVVSVEKQGWGSVKRAFR